MSRVAIVGAGIAGVSTAFFLKKEGFDVTVYDHRGGVGKGATSVCPPILPLTQSQIIDNRIVQNTLSRFSPLSFITGSSGVTDKQDLRTFLDVFGYNFLNLLTSEKLVGVDQKLSILTLANRQLVLDLVKDLQLNIPINFGFLRVATDRDSKNNLEGQVSLHKEVYTGYTGEILESTDVTRMFPQFQNRAFEVSGGVYEPSTAIIDPVELTEELYKQAEAMGVKFDLHTEVRQLHVENGKVTRITTDKGDIPVDNLVLCSGYSTFSLTDNLHEKGAIAPLIPVRSVSVDIADTTPNSLPLPTVFPTKPLVFLEPVVSNKTPIENYPPEDDILQSTYIPRSFSGENKPEPTKLVTQPSGIQEDPMSRVKSAAHRATESAMNAVATAVNTKIDFEHVYSTTHDGNQGLLPVNRTINGMTGLKYQPAAVSLASVNAVIAAHPNNPRAMKAYLGQDMTDIDESMPLHQLQPLVDTLEELRKVTKGSYINTSLEDDYSSRKPQSGEIVSARRFRVQPDTMGLHTVGKDGLPLIGKAPEISNLFMNTGHGINPMATSVYGGKMVAAILKDQVTNGQEQMKADPTKVHPFINIDDYSPQRFDIQPMKPLWFRNVNTK